MILALPLVAGMSRRWVQRGTVDGATFCGECKPSINLVYRHLFLRVNQQTDHDGSSTYAEVKRASVSKMIQVIKMIPELFKPSLIQRGASTFCAIDLGGGYLTCLDHIAQVIPGKYAAIKYCEARLLGHSRTAMESCLLTSLRVSVIQRLHMLIWILSSWIGLIVI